MQILLQDIKIGGNLRKIRKECKLTQPQVITKMQLLGSNLSRSAYANIESGLQNIKVSDLILLKHVFDVDYEEFFRDLINIS